MHRYYEILIKNHIFDGITLDEMKFMGVCFNSKILHYDKGTFVFSEGEIFRNLGIVASGIVNIIRDDSRGNRVILEQAGAGAILDESITLKKDFKVDVTAAASTVCDIVSIPFDKLVTVCSMNCPFHVKLLSNIVRLIAINHNALTMKVDHLSKKSLRHKLLSFLRYESEKHGKDEFDITFDRKELAEFLVVDRSALSRELGRMKKAKIISFRKNHFKLNNISD